jgi:superoxide reductase
MVVTEKPNEREIGRKAEEPAVYPITGAESGEKHIVFIEAPKSVIAGEPFEVIVTVTGIPSITYEKPHVERIELYLHDKLIGHKKLTPPTAEETESVFKIEAEEALLAIKDIETCKVQGTNILCGSTGEKSIITNLRAVVSCNNHGFSQAVREIEMLSGEFKEVEEVKNVFVKPEDQKEYLEKGP